LKLTTVDVISEADVRMNVIRSTWCRIMYKVIAQLLHALQLL